MQIVYFLLLPSALLSVGLSDHCVVASTRSNSLLPGFGAVFATWFVMGCFGLAARWLEKTRKLFLVSESGVLVGPWWLKHRHSLLLWLWCCLQPICLAATGWSNLVQTVAPAEFSCAAYLLLLIAPSGVLLFLIELITSSLGQHMQLILIGRRVWQNATHTWIFPLLLPLLVATLFDTINIAMQQIPNHRMFAGVVAIILSSMMTTLLIPHVFAWLILAKPTDSAIEERVLRTWKIGSRRSPQVLQWPTGCRVANAAVVGMIAYGRKLILTDALLQKLNDRELSMVVLHELAHCVRFHAWIRVLPTLLTIAMLLGVMTVQTGFVLSASCIALLALFLASLIGVCWWTEFDADRVAVDLAMRFDSQAADQDRHVFATELIEALQKIYGSRNLTRSSWLHPSCNRRVAAITMRFCK